MVNVRFPKSTLLFTLLLAMVTMVPMARSASAKSAAPAASGTIVVSPNPAVQGTAITVAITNQINSVDGSGTRFCIYGNPGIPMAAYPPSITLSANTGTSTVTVPFNSTGGAGNCPAVAGAATPLQYDAVPPIPSGTYTYSGSFVIPAGATANATVGATAWYLALQGVVGSRTITWSRVQDNHTFEVPSAVTLEWFRAEAHDGKVALSWQTTYEMNSLGFHLYRSDERGSEVRITHVMIPAVGGMMGAAYAYDDTTVTVGTPYTYTLVEVDTFGQSTVVATATVTP